MKPIHTLFLLIGGLLVTSIPAIFAETDPTATPTDLSDPPAEAQTTASGITHNVLKKGTGTNRPTAEDEVEVHYSGWTLDGKNFDSSYSRKSTTTFPLTQVIKGWTEGVQLMVEGEKRRFWIPAPLAYGENPGGGRPGGKLVFDIELVRILRPPADMSKFPEGIKKSESGLGWEPMSKGTGDTKPQSDAMVTMQIIGWDEEKRTLINGPLRFPLNEAPIAGWVEAAQLMVRGEKRRFWIPESLASGKNSGLPSGNLVFEMELLDFRNPQPAPPVPQNLKEIPAEAETTASGLASIVLTKGKGGDKPGPTSQTKVHYSGWTTDGTMFDSSVVRGNPAIFALDGVIAGWTEGLQLMEKGEKRRFWIPAKLAYENGGPPGAPQGMLIFDIELIDFK